MKDTLTVTTKGTVTIPAKIRRDMGINQHGDYLSWSFDHKRQQLVLKKKSVDIRNLHKQLQKYIKGIPPLEDVGAFYQQREPRL